MVYHCMRKSATSGRCGKGLAVTPAESVIEEIGFWLAAVVAEAVVMLGKGGVPSWGWAVPIMALMMDPVVAAGMLLPVYAVSDRFGPYAYRHAFDRRVLPIQVPGATFGIGVGWATAKAKVFAVP